MGTLVRQATARMNWTFGFNHEKVVDCFRNAAYADRFALTL